MSSLNCSMSKGNCTKVDGLSCELAKHTSRHHSQFIHCTLATFDAYRQRQHNNSPNRDLLQPRRNDNVLVPENGEQLVDVVEQSTEKSTDNTHSNVDR
eukprot:m.61745 g.61745  ORF g.61745 m.61745 type:complete len:98 (+) comp11878_c0_seq4:1786-2079(+)